MSRRALCWHACLVPAAAMPRALGCQAPPLPHPLDTSDTHLVLGPGLVEGGTWESPLLCLVPQPSVCSFVLSGTSPLVSCVHGG